MRVAGSGGDEDDSREVHWFVVLDQGRKRIRLNRQTLHTSRVWFFNLGHECGRDRVMWDTVVFLLLIVKGGDTISMMGISSCSKQDRGGMIPGQAQAHVSRSARRE